MVGAAPPGGNDVARIQELLSAAGGYAVFTREGKRVGAVIELEGSAVKQIVIRHDGIFLWRRRVLPITAVADVLPKDRVVLLNVDRHSLARGEAGLDADMVETPLPAEKSAGSSLDVQRRVARYLYSGELDTDQAGPVRADAAHRPSVEPTASEHVESAELSIPSHLAFISSSQGYALAELDGPPPDLGQEIELPEQPGSFHVAKLGPSPLPNDPRTCAYLEHTANDRWAAERRSESNL
jgi:hypothetical protein